MVQSRACLVAALVLLGSGARGQEAGPEAGQAPAPPAEGQAAPYAGPLQKAPSPTFYPLRPSTPLRAAPSPAAPVLATIDGQGQPLKALGMAVDPDADAYRSLGEDAALARTWIKVATASGRSGFVSLADLITPRQLASQKESRRKVSLFEAEIAAARRVSGGAVPAGIYAHGSVCDADGLSGAALSDFLGSKFLLWQDGDKLHFVQVVNPTQPLVYEQLKDSHPVEMRGYGYVMLQTFRSSKDQVLMGFKDRLLWISVTGAQFDNYQFCGPESYDAILAMLGSYAGQRPPEAAGNGRAAVR